MTEASYTHTLLYYFCTVDTTEACKKGVLTKGKEQNTKKKQINGLKYAKENW